MTRRAVAVVAAVVLAVTAYAAADAADAVPGVLTTRAPEAAAPSAGSGAPPGATPQAVPGPAGVALDPAAPTPDAAGLRAAVGAAAAVPALGTSVAYSIRDAATGKELLAEDAGRAATPASSTKVVTAAAVTSVTKPGDRFTTRVVGGASGSIVLVAGGDNLLADRGGSPGTVAGRAGLDELARATAKALARRTGTGSRTAPLSLVLDDRSAAGPALAPGWAKSDVAAGITGPVAMLGLARDRAVVGRAASADPAMTAASAFRAALARAGVSTAPTVARGAAPAGATTLASVESAPVQDVLALALDDSDNDLTESVARWTCAAHGAPTTFAGCAAWVRSTAVGLGLPAAGLTLTDTSGLSPGTSVPAGTLSSVVTLATTGTRPGLSRVLSQLPVAGLTGTLADRYRTGPEHRGAGVVRAKTGTLTGVSSLTGTVATKEGRLLAFSIVADAVPAAGTLQARAALDRITTTLADCGCRASG